MPRSRAKAQVIQGGARQAAAQLLQELALAKVRQFLHECGIIDQYLQDTATEWAHPGMRGIPGSEHGGPYFFQVQLTRTPAPAPGREETSENLTQRLNPRLVLAPARNRAFSRMLAVGHEDPRFLAH